MPRTSTMHLEPGQIWRPDALATLCGVKPRHIVSMYGGQAGSVAYTQNAGDVLIANACLVKTFRSWIFTNKATRVK
jgi:hypothetical protein